MADASTDRWRELVRAFEQGQLTLRACVARIRTELIPPKEQLARDEAFIAEVAARLRDRNFRIRVLATETLGLLACPGVAVPLLQAERNETSREARHAMKTAVMGLPGSCITQLLGKHGDMHHSSLALEALTALGEPVVEPACQCLASAPSKHRIDRLLILLRNLADPRAGAIIEATYVSRPSERSNCLDALLRTGTPHPVGVVRHALTDPSSMLRGRACDYAAAFQVTEVLPELRRAARDVDSYVRGKGRAALEQLGEAESTDAGDVPSLMRDMSVDDVESAMVLDLRSQDLDDAVLEQFLLPLRTPSDGGPFDRFEVRYFKCAPVDIYVKRWDADYVIAGGPAALLKPGDTPENLAEAGIKVLVPTAVTIGAYERPKLRARISATDAATVEATRDSYGRGNFPVSRPVLLALPRKFDGRGERVTLRVPRPRMAKPAMLFPPRSATAAPESRTASQLPHPYALFEHAFPSQEWLSAEQYCIRRAFEMGRLKRLAKGARHGQIQILTPGAGPKPERLDTGLFERWMSVTAYQVADEYRSMFEVSSVYAKLFGYSDLPPLPRRSLDNAASLIGASVGLAVAAWNVVGRLWIDLWSEHQNDGISGGFLDFYRQFQSVRMDVPADAVNIADLARKTVAAVAAAGPRPAEFGHDADVRAVLGMAAFPDHQTAALIKSFKYWQAVRLLFQRLHQQPGTHHPAAPADTPPERQLEAFSAALSGAGDFLDAMVKADGVIKLLQHLGVNVLLDPNDHSTPAHFNVKITRDGRTLALQPIVRAGMHGTGDANGLLILLHELGHGVLHTRWVGEVQLMIHCADRIEETQPAKSARIREVALSARASMVKMHSAVERAADRFALHFLITPAFIGQLRSAFVEDGSVKIVVLDEVVMMRLGVDRQRYYARFGPLIWPMLGLSRIASDGAVSVTTQLLDAMDSVSDERVERLLRDHWARVRSILDQPGTPAAPDKRKGRDAANQLAFTGIECDPTNAG